MPKLNIYKNEKETCLAFAEWLADTIAETLTKSNTFTIAFAQEETPKILFKVLASEFAKKIDWSKVHIFEGNQRPVSNNSLLNVFIDYIPIPRNQIYFIPTGLPQAEAMQEYENLLKTFFKEESSFDLAILSMGENGSFLSQSSREEQIKQNSSIVTSILNKENNTYSISVLTSVINAAKTKAFLVTGKRKEDVVQQVLKGKYDPEKYPAQLIQTTNKTVHWFMDEAAATRLIKSSA